MPIIDQKESIQESRDFGDPNQNRNVSNIKVTVDMQSESNRAELEIDNPSNSDVDNIHINTESRGEAWFTTVIDITTDKIKFAVQRMVLPGGGKVTDKDKVFDVDIQLKDNR